MKKNYSIPQIEVSEMMANAILAASGTGSTIGDTNQSVTGDVITNGPKVNETQATGGVGAGAKHTTDHFNF